MLAGRESRVPNLVNTGHPNTAHPPWSTGHRLALLLFQTTYNPMTFQGLGPWVRSPGKTLYRSPNLQRTEKHVSSWVELGKRQGFPILPTSSQPRLGAPQGSLEPWTSVEHSWKTPGPIPRWCPSTSKIASSGVPSQFASRLQFLVASRRCFETLHWEFQVFQILSVAHVPGSPSAFPSHLAGLISLPSPNRHHSLNYFK